MKNKKVLAGAAAIVLLGVGFGGGYMFAKSQTPARGQFTQNGTQFAARGQGTRSGGFTAGQIIAKDASSITIKTQDGSTKIVLMGASAQVMKNAAGNVDDLVVGTNVTIMGATNTDDSVTAQSVQIRPQMTGSTTPRQ